jgi:hypothetical protein
VLWEVACLEKDGAHSGMSRLGVGQKPRTHCDWPRRTLCFARQSETEREEERR